MKTFTRIDVLNAPLSTVEASFSDWWKAGPEAGGINIWAGDSPDKVGPGTYLQTKQDGEVVIKTTITFKDCGQTTKVEYQRTVDGMPDSALLGVFLNRGIQSLLKSWTKSFNAYLKHIGPTPPQL